VIDWAWLADHADAFVGRTWQHLYLAAIALLVGFLISFVLAVVSVRRRALYPPLNGLTGILFTIPSLAFFAALVSVTGISLLTVEVPLVVYTLVIFVRNIVAGFDAVPLDVLEAADGMGYTQAQRLWRVEVPLALPLIVAGLRVASVSTIGLVTITATLGDRFGGLGFFILEGNARFFPTETWAGGVLSVVLALAVDAVLVRLQAWLMPWTRRLPERPAPDVAAAAGSA
jgi:osmoprotectant transport system permease protein